MKIRKRIISEVRGCNDKAVLTKALSLVLFYRMKVVENESVFSRMGATANGIKGFSYNKVRKVTGLHINTIKTRLRTAERFGIVERHGSDLIIKGKVIKSSHSRNNYTHDNNFTSIIELQDWLLAHIIVNIQEAKEYAKDIFGKIHSPRPNDKKTWNKARRIARERYPFNSDFADNGISYRCLVENLGIRKTKLKSLLRFAEQNGIVQRTRNIRQVEGNEAIYYRQLESMDLLLDHLRQRFGRLMHYFFTKSNVYLCFANTYSIVAAPAGIC